MSKWKNILFHLSVSLHYKINIKEERTILGNGNSGKPTNHKEFIYRSNPNLNDQVNDKIEEILKSLEIYKPSKMELLIIENKIFEIIRRLGF